MARLQTFYAYGSRDPRWTDMSWPEFFPLTNPEQLISVNIPFFAIYLQAFDSGEGNPEWGFTVSPVPTPPEIVLNKIGF